MEAIAVKKKRLTYILGIFFILSLPLAAFGGGGGDIQITCEPDVRIWVNDTFKGKTTSTDSGMFIESIRPGSYRIKAVKSGFEPVIQEVHVASGETVEVKIILKTPAMKIENLTTGSGGGDRATIGTIIFRSVPLHAEIFLDGRKIGTTDTKASNIETGSHHIKFVYRDQILEERYILHENQTLKLKAHFKKGYIIKEHEEVTVNTIGMQFVKIMPDVLITRNAPGKATRIQEFYMQTTEVTQAQWMSIMERNPSKFHKRGADHPVESVSWNDVQEFIRRLNQREQTESYRLPTQSEWEYCCRAGKTTKFCFGDATDEETLGQYAWYENNSKNKTHEVGTKKPNVWGLYDMHGNVLEFCQDLYSDMNHVARGGDYLDRPDYLECSVEEIVTNDRGNSTIGFRLVKIP
jgi:hypothetical protein